MITIMRVIGTVFLIGLLIGLGWGIYRLSLERQLLENRAGDLKAQIDSLKEETGKTGKEIEYFSAWENLEKEAKSQFNYTKPDEKLIIIVPGTSTEQ